MTCPEFEIPLPPIVGNGMEVILTIVFFLEPPRSGKSSVAQGKVTGRSPES